MEKRYLLGAALKFLCLPPVLFLLSALSTQVASTDHVRLLAEACREASPDLVSVLASEWRTLGRYVQLCPVHAPDGTLALQVLTARIDQAMRDGFFVTHRDATAPNALILDNRSRIIGDLGEGFPENPPSKLEVSFTDWYKGFPWRIDLYEAGVSAIAPHPLPSLFWDRRQQRYVDGPNLTWAPNHHSYIEGWTLIWDRQHRWFVPAR